MITNSTETPMYKTPVTSRVIHRTSQSDATSSLRPVGTLFPLPSPPTTRHCSGSCICCLPLGLGLSCLPSMVLSFFHGALVHLLSLSSRAADLGSQHIILVSPVLPSFKHTVFVFPPQNIPLLRYVSSETQRYRRPMCRFRYKKEGAACSSKLSLIGTQLCNDSRHPFTIPRL